jgi:hypothetical protein
MRGFRICGEVCGNRAPAQPCDRATTLKRHRRHPVSPVSIPARFSFHLAPAVRTRIGRSFHPQTAGAAPNESRFADRPPFLPQTKSRFTLLPPSAPETASRFTQKRREQAETTPVLPTARRLPPKRVPFWPETAGAGRKNSRLHLQTTGIAYFFSISPLTPIH